MEPHSHDESWNRTGGLESALVPWSAPERAAGYISLPRALMVVHLLVYPHHHTKLIARIASSRKRGHLPLEDEQRLARCEFILRRELMRSDMSLFELGEDGSIARTDNAHVRTSAENYAQFLERHGLLAAADFYRGRGTYNDAMRVEHAMEKEALGYLPSALAARASVLFSAGELLDRLESVVADLASGVTKSVLHEMDAACERLWSLRDVGKPPGRPLGTFKPLQARIVGILIDAGDPELDVKAIRSRLATTRGVKMGDGYVDYKGRDGPQRVKWSSLRDALKRPREEARRRLAAAGND